MNARRAVKLKLSLITPNKYSKQFTNTKSAYSRIKQNKTIYMLKVCLPLTREGGYVRCMGRQWGR